MNDTNRFDGAGIGRPAQRFGQALTAYSRIERVLAPDELREFHTSGSIVLAGRGLTLEHHVLSTWEGFRSFAERILRLVALEQPNCCGALVHYGSRTGLLFEAVLSRTSDHEIVCIDNFYEPWLLSLSSRHVSWLQLDTTDLWQTRALQGNAYDLLTERVVKVIMERRPRVVFLPVVTQRGLRMPIEGIAERVSAQWAAADIGWYPLLVLDGCQAFGRIPTELGAGVLHEAGCAYIGCLHKAIRGPKEIAFLVCTNAGWHHALTQACESERGLSEMPKYARSGGTAPGLSTSSLGMAVAASIHLETWSHARIKSNFERILNIEDEFRQALRGTAWSVLNPVDKRLWSGIVVLRPPETSVHASHRDSIKHMLSTGQVKIYVDQVDDLVRVAFEGHHATDAGRELAEELALLAQLLGS